MIVRTDAVMSFLAFIERAPFDLCPKAKLRSDGCNRRELNTYRQTDIRLLRNSKEKAHKHIRSKIGTQSRKTVRTHKSKQPRIVAHAKLRHRIAFLPADRAHIAAEMLRDLGDGMAAHEHMKHLGLTGRQIAHRRHARRLAACR